MAYPVAVCPAGGQRTWTVLGEGYATVGPGRGVAGGSPAPVVAEHGARLCDVVGAVVELPGATRTDRRLA